MIPEVSKRHCVGSMTCVGIAPEVFRIDSDGQAEALHTEGDYWTQIQEAIDACPVSAISMVENGTSGSNSIEGEPK